MGGREGRRDEREWEGGRKGGRDEREWEGGRGGGGEKERGGRGRERMERKCLNTVQLCRLLLHNCHMTNAIYMISSHMTST